MNALACLGRAFRGKAPDRPWNFARSLRVIPMPEALGDKQTMHSHHVHHVDEISVWSWVSAAAFALIAITAIVLATQNKIDVVTGITNPSLPLTAPALMPSEVPEPRA
jgi:hypothetical protein